MNTFVLTNTPLTQLEQADLIRRLRELEEVYQFKHALVQESAYMSLLKNDRRKLHRACARALEDTFPNALDEHAALLAQHYAEAGDETKTFEYARRAGDAALHIHALPEALMQYDTAALLAPRLPISTADLVHVHTRRGRVLELMGRYDEAIAAYRALQEMGQNRGDPAIELGALLPLATLFIFPNRTQDMVEGLHVNQRALALAQALGDDEAQARALWNMQQHAYFSGRASESVAYSKQALAIVERAGLREMRAYILNDVSRAQMTAESVPAALESLAQARVLWRELNNLPMLVDNLSTTAETAHVGGEIEMALDYVRQTQELAQTIGNTWNLAYSNGTLLTVYTQSGETRLALELAPKIRKLSQQSGFFVAAYLTDVMCGEIYGELGDAARGIALLEQVPENVMFAFMEAWRIGAIAFLHLQRADLPAARAAMERAAAMDNADDFSTLGPVYKALCGAELALAEGRFADAISHSRRMTEKMRVLGIRDFLAEILLRQGRAYLGLEEWDAATSVLKEAEQVARFTISRFALWEILAALSELETRRSNPERAGALRNEARDIVEWLTQHAPAEFQATFRAQPKVQALFKP